MSPQAEQHERLHRDAFPVEVYIPGLAEHPLICRVFVTDRRVIIWTADPNPSPTQGWQPPRLLLDEPYTSDMPVERDRGSFRGQLRLTTPQGMVFVTKGAGCGCSNPLKALGPPVGWA